MNGPPTVLLQLTRLLNDPRRTYSRGRYWLLILAGVVELGSATWFFAASYTEDYPLLAPILFTIGVMILAQGADGLFREANEGLSLWLRVLQTLCLVPLVLLWATQWYAWWGLPGVGACILVVGVIFVWDRAQRERMTRESGS